jgi:hypothetical protein
MPFPSPNSAGGRYVGFCSFDDHRNSRESVTSNRLGGQWNETPFINRNRFSADTRLGFSGRNRSPSLLLAEPAQELFRVVGVQFERGLGYDAVSLMAGTSFSPIWSATGSRASIGAR